MDSQRKKRLYRRGSEDGFDARQEMNFDGCWGARESRETPCQAENRLGSAE